MLGSSTLTSGRVVCSGVVRSGVAFSGIACTGVVCSEVVYSEMVCSRGICLGGGSGIFRNSMLGNRSDMLEREMLVSGTCLEGGGNWE